MPERGEKLLKKKNKLPRLGVVAMNNKKQQQLMRLGERLQRKPRILGPLGAPRLQAMMQVPIGPLLLRIVVMRGPVQAGDNLNLQVPTLAVVLEISEAEVEISVVAVVETLVAAVAEAKTKLAKFSWEI